MSQVLIAYYSRTGTARQVAQQLQQLSGWPIGEVRDVRPRAGFAGDLRCVIDSLFARSGPFTFDGPALESADHLVVVAPIWVDGLASPMRAMLRQCRAGTAARPAGPVSLVCVMSRGGAFRAADEVASIVGAVPAPVLGLKQSDVLSGNVLASLQSLVDNVTALDAERVVTRPIWLSPAAA